MSPSGNHVFWKTVVASSISGSLARTITFPLDTWRVRSQLDLNSKLLSWKSFFNGYGVALIGSLPASAVYLSSYDIFKRTLSNRIDTRENNSKQAFVILTSGLLAECVSGLFWCPMEVVKQTMQGTERGFSEVIQQLNSNGIIRSLFRGYWAQLAVFGPYSMTFFYSYERFKQFVGKLEHSDHRYLTIPESALCAFGASALAAFVSAPPDVVKTRIQVGRMAGFPETSVASAAKSIYERDGLKGFLKGSLARGTQLVQSL